MSGKKKLMSAVPDEDVVVVIKPPRVRAARLGIEKETKKIVREILIFKGKFGQNY
jgi:hypothetical protein